MDVEGWDSDGTSEVVLRVRERDVVGRGADSVGSSASASISISEIAFVLLVSSVHEKKQRTYFFVIRGARFAFPYIISHRPLPGAREYTDLCDLCCKEQTIWVFSTMLFPIHQPLLLLFSRIVYARRTYMGSSSSSHSSTSYSHRGHFTASSEPFEGVNTNPALAN